MNKVPLPIQESIRDFYADLLGRDVSATKAPHLELGVEGEGDADGDGDGTEPVDGRVAVYRDADATVRAVAVADLSLAAGGAAALTLVPSVVLAEVISTGVMPDSLAENDREVANVFSALLNTASSPHLVLDDVVELSPDLDPQIRAVLEEPGRRRDFEVTIDGYGGGHLAVLAASND
jgi:hypothetical protein